MKISLHYVCVKSGLFTIIFTAFLWAGNGKDVVEMFTLKIQKTSELYCHIHSNIP